MDVAVIIPTYNREKLLPDAIDSVVAQTADCCIEVVVIDDGSTDDTQRVMGGYMQGIIPLSLPGRWVDCGKASFTLLIGSRDAGPSE